MISRSTLRVCSIARRRVASRPLSEVAAVAAAPSDAGSSKPVRHTRSKEAIEALTIHKAVSKIKELAWANFDETIELSINTNLDPRKPNQSVKGVATLPYGTGKTVRVCVFAAGNEAQEALSAGADVVGGDELIAKIQGGNINFDTVIATPDMMSVVGKLGRVRNTSICTSCVALWPLTGPPLSTCNTDPGPKRPDAQPEDRHGDEGHGQGGARSQGWRGEVQGGEEGHHLGGHRQEELFRRGAAGQHPRVHARRRGGEAGGSEGQVSEGGAHLLDDGARRARGAAHGGPRQRPLYARHVDKRRVEMFGKYLARYGEHSGNFVSVLQAARGIMTLLGGIMSSAQ